MTALADRLAVAETIVAAAADMALRHFRGRRKIKVDAKGPRDFVSEADRETELLARKLLSRHFPDDILIGEEFGGIAADDFWLLDPIDGTTNFLNGLPLWAVSLAYVSEGEPVLGVIALPALGETVSAAAGLGLRIQPDVIPTPHVGSDISLAGIGRNGRWPARERFELEQGLEHSGISTVCLGSCAASLAMVATGRLAGYGECQVRPWDVAAGEIVCREAGRAVHVARHGATVDVYAGDPVFLDICRRHHAPLARNVTWLAP